MNKNTKQYDILRDFTQIQVEIVMFGRCRIGRQIALREKLIGPFQSRSWGKGDSGCDERSSGATSTFQSKHALGHDRAGFHIASVGVFAQHSGGEEALHFTDRHATPCGFGGTATDDWTLGRAGRHDWISVAEESVSVRKRGLLEELERLRAELHQTLTEELERVRAEQDHVGDDGGDESNSGDRGDEAHDTKDADSSGDSGEDAHGTSLAKASLDDDGGRDGGFLLSHFLRLIVTVLPDWLSGVSGVTPLGALISHSQGKRLSGCPW